MLSTALAVIAAALPAPHVNVCATHPRCLARVQAKRRAARPMRTAGASWFDDQGAIACSSHHRLGVAHRTLPCGTRVWMCARWCATVTVEDRGPFVAGRDWDLNPAAKRAIGFGDVGPVRWRLA